MLALLSFLPTSLSLSLSVLARVSFPHTSSTSLLFLPLASQFPSDFSAPSLLTLTPPSCPLSKPRAERAQVSLLGSAASGSSAVFSGSDAAALGSMDFAASLGAASSGAASSSSGFGASFLARLLRCSVDLHILLLLLLLGLGLLLFGLGLGEFFAASIFTSLAAASIFTSLPLSPRV